MSRRLKTVKIKYDTTKVGIFDPQRPGFIRRTTWSQEKVNQYKQYYKGCVGTSNFPLEPDEYFAVHGDPDKATK